MDLNKVVPLVTWEIMRGKNELYSSIYLKVYIQAVRLSNQR
jgi:hypothetical protein